MADVIALDAPKVCARDCDTMTMLEYDGTPLCPEHDDGGRGPQVVEDAHTGDMAACDVLRLSAAQQMAPADVEPGAVTARGVVARVYNDRGVVTIVFFDDTHYTVAADENVTVLGRVDRALLRRLKAVS